MSVTVKAYLELTDGKTEIRRFPIDQSVSSSFEYLASKIAQVFPALTRAKFDVRWKGYSFYKISIYIYIYKL
jgi:hypothetical protein